MDYTQFIPKEDLGLFISYIIIKPKEIYCARCGELLVGRLKQGGRNISYCPECQARARVDHAEELNAIRKYKNRNKDYKVCAICGTKFHAFGRQKYCEECKSDKLTRLGG